MEKSFTLLSDKLLAISQSFTPGHSCLMSHAFWALSACAKGLICDFKSSCQVLGDLTDSEIPCDRHFCHLLIFVLCLSTCLHVYRCALHRSCAWRGHQIPWKWSHRQLQDPIVVARKQNPGPLHEQQMPLTSQLIPQSWHFCFKNAVLWPQPFSTPGQKRSLQLSCSALEPVLTGPYFHWEDDSFQTLSIQEPLRICHCV